MKPLLHNLIGPSQSSFLTNQRASDNAILVQEILHFFNTAKGGKAHMTAKIDLEKAFDRLEWSFIHDTLLHFNFPSKFIGFIMSCITSSSVSILLNGSVTPYFYPFRGIRQGDPLFTYIFILCMERLSRCIDIAVDYGLWSPIKICTRAPPLSHLFFADDIILCAVANSPHARKFQEFLHTLIQFLAKKLASQNRKSSSQKPLISLLRR